MQIYTRTISQVRTSIVEVDSYEWICLCGNTPDTYGFFPCNEKGGFVEPTDEQWTTDCYVCDKCGRIINQNTLELVGIRANITQS